MVLTVKLLNVNFTVNIDPSRIFQLFDDCGDVVY